MHASSHTIGRWYIGYGLFLILCGVAGYLSNPAAAKTALMSGGTFGLLSALWGFWILKGGRLFAFIAAFATTFMLCGVFTWRSIVSWQAVAAGEAKLFAASLITAMLIASLLSIFKLTMSRRVLLPNAIA
ncbi:MAG: hypothetical protein EA353_10930 [Puniceicoccaceae bacterium]|nr:MAG: hypothetical protein EA353_10930 [Puniceicoccaceae bacterium]